ncbi:MAG TPA: TolC family protein [Bryobacteraceae bacterium]|nr:TolC family protein [Bryobacteraceae bacterium]
MKKRILKSAVLAAASAAAAFAQLGGPPPQPGGGSVAAQLPLSGRTGQSGTVTTTQTPTPGTNASVNTLNTNISIQGSYAGSISSTTTRPFSGKLSLHEAVERGLAANMSVVGLNAAVKQAEGQAKVARSALLPNISGSYRENVLEQDLQVIGLNFPGVPHVVGPLAYFDLRATVAQSLVDMTALNNLKAAHASTAAQQQSIQNARDIIVLAVGGAYLQTIAAKARLTSAKAQLDTATAQVKETTDSFHSGVATQIDVNRAQVQESVQRQRVSTLENDLARQKISLARLIGLPPNDNYDITDDVPFSAPPALTVDDAVKQSLDTRADLKAAQTQVHAAELAKTAAKDERLPTLSILGDYGAIGPRYSQTATTFTFGASLKVPIWQGGRASADLEQADAVLDQRRAEVEDLRGEIESEIRNSWLDLQAAANQVELAKENQKLAQDTLRLTKEKADLGVATLLEVTQAEADVASSELDYITSLFAHNLAKLSIARELGNTDKRIDDYLHPVTQ